MPWVVPVMMVAGTVLSAYSAMEAGKDAKDTSKLQAGAMTQQAGQERAASQRVAAEERRKGRLAQSRALALAAASGGGASDPTVTNILSGIEGESEYNALSAMYEGEERARTLETNASITKKYGKDTKSAYQLQAASTVLKGGGSLMGRYGGSFS